MAKLKLPFELEKPSSNEYVTQTSEIGHNGQPLDEQIDKKPDVRSTEELANAFYIVDENGNVIAKLAGGDIKTKNFDSSQSAPLKMVYDCDFLIADTSGNVIVEFKDGHIKTKNFDSSQGGSGGLNYTQIY